MKYLQLLLFVPLVLLLNACSTHQGGAGYYDENTGSGMQSGPMSPSSPSMRPGMTPQDPRDPQHFTNPQPSEPPPTTTQ